MFWSSAPLADTLNDAIPGLIPRCPLLQKELPVLSSTQPHCSKGTWDDFCWRALDMSYTESQCLRWDRKSCRNQVCSVRPRTAHCRNCSHTLQSCPRASREQAEQLPALKEKIHFAVRSLQKRNPVSPEDSQIILPVTMKKSKQHLTYSLHLRFLTFISPETGIINHQLLPRDRQVHQFTDFLQGDLQVTSAVRQYTNSTVTRYLITEHRAVS